MKMVTVSSSLLLFLCSMVLIAAPSLLNANPLNNWKVSCGVDSGSYEKKVKTHVFRTSSNHCVGGTFNQRSEIFTKNVPPNHKGAYQFSSRVSFTSSSTEEFSIFQFHDGRNGCAPPFKLNVGRNGRLSLEGAYKVGNQPGNNCVQIASYSGKYSKAKIGRDGSEHLLNVTIAFDGNAGFRFLGSP
ncbi:hypothetical protein [Ruegeria arenilitoris]|uniref:hypothetical protein n=1 Tax=Ruegeria arenilitoris TaxID=1173585 RepID=UPI00147C31F5|nr:hypothetical protein [Ruegeria arenilitoris]